MKKQIQYTTSKQLIKNTTHFLNLRYYTFFDKLVKKQANFYGWGRKKSGLNAVKLARKNNTSFVLLEDGFIRSLGLGVDGSASFSLVEDDVGIYYDATVPSKLENILNSYDFSTDQKLMKDASRAIELMLQHNISKYNNAPWVDDSFSEKYGLGTGKHVLIIAQTAGDASLEYGMLDAYSTDDMVETAISENPDAQVYLKIHPDVLSGKKQSDIDIEKVKYKCMIIVEDVNPISLLKHFKKVYTKTSGMGFEALLCGCECVCFGMPYYAGWGVTTDKSICTRRTQKRNIEEIFAAAYIVYTRYYNPYKKKKSDIFDTMQEIVKQREIILKRIEKDGL